MPSRKRKWRTRASCCRPALGHDLHDIEIGEGDDQQNSTVMAMMLRIIGSVDRERLLPRALAPSIAAAS